MLVTLEKARRGWTKEINVELTGSADRLGWVCWEDSAVESPPQTLPSRKSTYLREGPRPVWAHSLTHSPSLLISLVHTLSWASLWTWDQVVRCSGGITAGKVRG